MQLIQLGLLVAFFSVTVDAWCVVPSILLPSHRLGSGCRYLEEQTSRCTALPVLVRIPLPPPPRSLCSRCLEAWVPFKKPLRHWQCDWYELPPPQQQ